MSDPDEPNDTSVIPSSSTGKHIYFADDDDDDDNQAEKSSTEKIIEREPPSTIRVDSSDLISRCKDFLPILSSSNINEPSRRLNADEKDEFDLLLEKNSKESGEASSSSSSSNTDEELTKKKRKKKKKKKKKKTKIDPQANLVNQTDALLG